MAPAKSILIRLVSSAGTGYFYAARKCVHFHARARLPLRPRRHAPFNNGPAPLRSRRRWAAALSARRPAATRCPHPPLFFTPRQTPPLRNPTNLPHKLAFMKYDPVVRQHVLFQES